MTAAPRRTTASYRPSLQRSQPAGAGGRANLRGAAIATPFVTNIDYDAKGQRTLIDYGNGVRTTYEYDPLTFRSDSHLTDACAAADARCRTCVYTYDPAGNITHIRDDAQQTIYFNGQVVEPHCDYTYDAIYRLIEATGREHIGQTGGQPEHHLERRVPRRICRIPTTARRCATTPSSTSTTRSAISRS